MASATARFSSTMGEGASCASASSRAPAIHTQSVAFGRVSAGVAGGDRGLEGVGAEGDRRAALPTPSAARPRRMRS